jgi:hypothetical protein
MPTDEQRAADTAVREAVDRAVRAYHLIPEDASIVDFVVVVEAIRIRPDGEDVGHDEFRALLYRDGMVRTSVALGLLHQATRMIDAAVDEDPTE